jgi:hypothetical protein
VRRLVVVGLRRVGSGCGTGTEDMCRVLAAQHVGVEIVAGGGGGRDVADLTRPR